MAQENQDVNGDGKIDIAITGTWLAVTDAVRYEVEVSQSSTSGGTFTVTGKGGLTSNLSFTFAANTNKYYKMRVRAYNAYGVAGSWTTVIVTGSGTGAAFSSWTGFKPAKKGAISVSSWGLFIQPHPLGVWMTWQAVTDEDYAFTEIGVHSSRTGTPSVSARTNHNEFIFQFAEPTGGYSCYYWIRHVNTSGVPGPWLGAGTSTTDGQLETTGYVLTAGIAPGSISTNSSVTAATSVACAAGTETTIMSLTLATGTAAKGLAASVIIYGSCRHISGAANTMSLALKNGTTTLMAIPTHAVDNNSIETIAWVVTPTANWTTFNLVVNLGAAGTCSHGRLAACVIWR